MFLHLVTFGVPVTIAFASDGAANKSVVSFRVARLDSSVLQLASNARKR